MSQRGRKNEYWRGRKRGQKAGLLDFPADLESIFGSRAYGKGYSDGRWDRASRIWRRSEGRHDVPSGDDITSDDGSLLPTIIGALVVLVLFVSAVWAVFSWAASYKPKPYVSEYLPTLTFGPSGTTFIVRDNPKSAVSPPKVSINPVAHQAYKDASRFFYRRQFSQAVSHLNEAIRLQPDYVDAYVLRGDAYGKLGDYDHALRDYDRALAFKPVQIVALHHRGDAYAGIARYDRAIMDYSSAVQLDPNDAHYYIDRALAYWSLRQYDSALRDWNTVAEWFPDNIEVALARGVTYAALRRYERAIQDARHVMTLDPSRAAAHFLVALVQKEMGRLQDARREYMLGVAELKPDDRVDDLDHRLANQARNALGAAADLRWQTPDNATRSDRH